MASSTASAFRRCLPPVSPNRWRSCIASRSAWRRCSDNGAYFYKAAKEKGLDTGSGCGTAVSPIVVGDSVSAVILSQQLFRRGINVQPVLYPAVPAKSSRLRFFLTAMHTEEQIEAATDAVVEELDKIPESMRSLKFPGYA